MLRIHCNGVYETNTTLCYDLAEWLQLDEFDLEVFQISDRFKGNLYCMPLDRSWSVCDYGSREFVAAWDAETYQLFRDEKAYRVFMGEWV